MSQSACITNSAEIQDETGLASHCRRVAALVAELAHSLEVPAEEREVLEKAALLHHTPLEMLGSGPSQRLLKDVLGEDWQRLVEGRGALDGVEPRVQRVLAALRRRSAFSKPNDLAALAAIVELCGFFDERIEFLPYERLPEEQVLKELGRMARDGIYDPQAVTALAKLRRVRREDLATAVRTLPVYPQVALDLLSLVPGDVHAVDELVRLASRDQVLAIQVMKAANSVVHGAREEITDIRHAVLFLGAMHSRKVMMVAALGPLFASRRLHELWEHSLEMATLAERLAVLSGSSSPSEAYLAGLVHDVGRLAIHQICDGRHEVFHRLLERGCPPVFAELVVCGFDHGQAGAEALRLWAFPAHMAIGVRFHHEPERAEEKLASILYLAEHWAASEEDLPSAVRLRYATQALGLTPEMIEGLVSVSAQPVIEVA